MGQLTQRPGGRNQEYNVKAKLKKSAKSPNAEHNRPSQKVNGGAANMFSLGATLLRFTAINMRFMHVKGLMNAAIICKAFTRGDHRHAAAPDDGLAIYTDK